MAARTGQEIWIDDKARLVYADLKVVRARLDEPVAERPATVEQGSLFE